MPQATYPESPRTETHPLRLQGRLSEPLNRWLWLVKWVLLVPHIVVLLFLWLAFAVVTVIAFFAIVFTGVYPPGLFAFNRGVLRWTWRVGFYGYWGLGTDQYPPFTLDEVPEYPATLDLDYPQTLSRGLVLVKSWLLLVPHYLLLGALAGAATVAADDSGDSRSGIGVLALLVLFAGLALLFVGRYPRGLFDFILGLNRWGFRVLVYAALMTDVYPPFRLDQGGDDVPVPTAPIPIWPSPAGATTEG